MYPMNEQSHSLLSIGRYTTKIIEKEILKFGRFWVYNAIATGNPFLTNLL